jgi:hypothetical protein
MVLGKRRFRLAQMKLIFPGEGLLRDPKSSQEAPSCIETYVPHIKCG